MSIQEAYAEAGVIHDEHSCEVCIDLDLTDYYFRAATDWKARLALVRLKDLLGAWHGDS